MKYDGMKREYKVEEIDNSFSVFVSFRLKSTGKPVQCYIEGCHEEANWQVNITTEKNKSILVCMKHHEEASSKGKHGSGALKYILSEAEAKARGER